MGIEDWERREREHAVTFYWSQTMNTTTTKPIPIFSKAGFVVGVVLGATFCKTVRGSVHMLRQPPAWCFDVSVLNAAERAGATEVDIFDSETGTHQLATIATIREHGFTFNRGHQEQVGLILAYWQTSPQERSNLQLTLFDT